MTTKKLFKKETQNNDINSQLKQLILHNDEDHTFDYVIDSLIEVCEHDTTQAEQCALITHYRGKCDVKKGEFSYLRNLRHKLVEKGLKVSID